MVCNDTIMHKIKFNRYLLHEGRRLITSSFVLVLSLCLSCSSSAMSTLEEMKIGGVRVLDTKSAVFYDKNKKYYLMTQKELGPWPNYTVLIAPYPTLFAYYLKGKVIKHKKLQLRCSNGIEIGDSVAKVRRKLGKTPQVYNRILLWNRYHNILSYHKKIVYKKVLVLMIQEYAVYNGKVEGILFGLYKTSAR